MTSLFRYLASPMSDNVIVGQCPNETWNCIGIVCLQSSRDLIEICIISPQHGKKAERNKIVITSKKDILPIFS